MYFAEIVVAATGVTLSFAISAITSSSDKLILLETSLILGILTELLPLISIIFLDIHITYC